VVPPADGTSEAQRYWNLQPYFPYCLPLAPAAPNLSGDISVSPARPVSSGQWLVVSGQPRDVTLAGH
jgi:hypothetical protein